MWKKFIPYWWPSRYLLLAGLGLLGVVAGLELLLPWPVKWLVDHVLGPHPVPEWMRAVWPWWEAPQSTGAILWICLSGLLIALLHRMATLWSQMLMIRVGGRLVLLLRSEGYEQFCRLSLAWHDRTKTGDSLYRIAYDTQAAMSLISGALVPLAQGILVLAGIILVLLQMSWFLTLVAVAVAPVFWLCIQWFGHRIETESKQYHQSESALVSTVQESLTSMRALQAFTREPDTSLHFRRLATTSQKKQQDLIRIQLWFSGSVGVAMAAGTALAIGLGAQQATEGRLSAGDLLVFLAYLGMLYQPLMAFSQSASVTQSARAQLRRVFEILDAAPAVTDPPNPVVPARVQGEVQFEAVTFGYDPQHPVLTDVSCRIAAGQVVALVGPTGAGKSTLASLLLRFYDPSKGRIRLDGVDLRDLRLSWLRANVSVVLQEALLLSGTVRDNIAYGRPEATMMEVEAAARQAQAHDFIRALPEGYDTNLAERAVNLSGGQKQRLAIARAFLKNAPILVLDEPTSALDAETEEALLSALQALVANRTTFLIAHRFSTIRLADRILVFGGGKLVEEGSHPELLKAQGLYARLYHAQAGPVEATSDEAVRS